MMKVAKIVTVVMVAVVLVSSAWGAKLAEQRIMMGKSIEGIHDIRHVAATLPIHEELQSRGLFLDLGDVQGRTSRALRFLLEAENDELELRKKEVEEILGKACQQLEEEMEREFREWRQEREREWGEQLRKADSTRQEAEDEMLRLHRAQAELVAGGDVNRGQGAILERLASLREQARELEGKLRGERAKEEALEERLGAMAESMKQRMADDLILENLERILELRAAALRRLAEVEADEEGEGGKQELAEARYEAEEAVLEARVELAQRQEELHEAAGAGLMQQLKEHLAMAALEVVQLEARHGFAEEQIEHIVTEKLVERAGEFEHNQKKLVMVRVRHEKAARQAEELRESIRALPENGPKITVVGRGAEGNRRAKRRRTAPPEKVIRAQP